MRNKTVILVTGPTASGKTSMALQLAELFNTEIISADSRQCFKEMNIGVAKPSSEELASVKHYFINSHSIYDEVNAAIFEAYALQAAAQIFQHHDIAIMAGGTGLYIKAFCEGLDDVPEVPAALRAEIIKGYEKNGLPWLQERLRIHDPLFFAEGEIQNPQRVMRALEVQMATGRSIKEFHRKVKVNRDVDIRKLGIDVSKEQLHTNINKRVDMMVEQGLIEEARSLWPHRHLNALQTVGYAELFDHFEQKLSLTEAIEQIKTNTRQYAKRQVTWFKRDREIQWLNTRELDREAIRTLLQM